MTQLTITKMNSKPYTGSYGLTNKVGILTVEYGEKWLNGFVNNVNFGVGSKIFAEVEEKGEFLNFRVKGIDLPKTQNYAPTAIVAPNLTTPIKTPEVNWDRISFGKCKYGFMIELLNSEPDYNSLEIKAEDLAKRAMRVLNHTEIKNYGNGDEVTQVPY